MANHKLSDKDKTLVIQRLAEGQSTRQSIKGTSIRSNQTAARLARSQSHAITQHRKNYLWGIEEEYDAGMAERARMWAGMIYANKYQVTNYHVQKDTWTGAITKVPYVDEVPDWKTRERALRYIDALAESVETGSDNKKVQLNFINDSSNFQINN